MPSSPDKADTRHVPEGLAQGPRLQGAGTGTPRPRVALGMPQARPVPAAVDRALQAVLPELIKGQPELPCLAPLRERLAALHDALWVAGEPGGLSSRDQSALGMTGLPPAEGAALLQSLVRGGLAGVGEVEGVLAAAGQTLARVTRDRDRIAAVDQAYDKRMGTERGRVLAAGLLRHLSGDAQLPVDAGTARDERLRAALTGPGGPLAALGASAGSHAPLSQRLRALGERHAELAQTVRKAQAELVIERFAAFDSLAVFHAPAQAQALEARQQPLHALIAQSRQDMQAVVAERRALLGPRGAGALRDAVRAAALVTHPDILPAGADPHGHAPAGRLAAASAARRATQAVAQRTCDLPRAEQAGRW